MEGMDHKHATYETKSDGTCGPTGGECPDTGRCRAGTRASSHRVGPGWLHWHIVLFVPSATCVDGGRSLNRGTSTEGPCVLLRLF